MDENSEIHFLIEKQLKRAHLTEADISVEKKGEWQDFLNRVSRTYYDQEQERYLLERSMEISSREMMDLNKKLEYAQEIAHLGYWFYDREKNELMWSKETFILAGIEPSEGTPPFSEIMSLVHEEDRPKLQDLIDRAFSEGKPYEMELRFKNKKDGKYHWHYAKGEPHIEKRGGKVQPIRSISGIAIDITDRKLNEENLKKMHQRLISISRQAGMAEVATSVLHNIGNILNSANISTGLLIESVKNFRGDKLVKIAEMIKEHSCKSDYLTKDEKGKLIPDYLLALAKNLAEEFQNYSIELANINSHLKHIKDIVALQKDISGIAGVKENILLPEVVNLALQMGCTPSECKEIEISKEYQYKGIITTEKAKLLQIIINLIRNARDSVLAANPRKKKINIFIGKKVENSTVVIKVQDNGQGISQENLIRIFSLGFTTKPTGHGFGLHSSAIAATELDGKLNVQSAGLNQGATFILELPLVKENLKPKEMDAIKEF